MGQRHDRFASDSKHFGAWDQNLTTQWHNFLLLPRLKVIHSQKLYRPETGKADAYANLQQILRKPIDWELVRQQYDQMVKYATALRLGTAETESILRRFTKKNAQHPTLYLESCSG